MFRPALFTEDSVIGRELFRCTYMLREEFKFGICDASRVPVLIHSPLDIGSETDCLCFYGRPWERSTLDRAQAMFRTIKDRALSLTGASHDEFTQMEILSMETVAHLTRFEASVEEGSDAKFQLANRIYRAACLAMGHLSLPSLFSNLDRIKDRPVFFTPPPDIDKCSACARRIISHCLAGMAVCEMVAGSAARATSLVSILVHWEPSRPLELVGVLRALLLLLDMSASRGLAYGWITDLVVLPLVLRHAPDKEPMERALIAPERWEVTRSGAVGFNQRIIDRAAGAIPLPNPGRSVRVHLVDGHIIERRCAACGEWDRVGNVFLRCSGCMRVYYCGKACQRTHWKEHKAECARK